MPVRKASAVWAGGGIKDGKGTIELGSGAFHGAYSFNSRFLDGPGTNPEELIGAAHAGCFSMALAAMLERAGHPPQNIATTAKVHIEKVGEGFKITRIELETEGKVAGIEDSEFQEIARKAKEGCPVSQALAGTEVVLNAHLSH
jgi:osmotically inducible protein OsmC